MLLVRPQGLLPARADTRARGPAPASPALPARGRLLRDRALAGEPERGRRDAGVVLTEAVWPPVALVALTCVVALVAWALGPDSLDRVVLGMVINLIVVVGLYTFVGVSGVFSFGHAAFMAIGAYTGAILVIPTETKRFVLPDLPGFLAGAHARAASGDDRRREPSPPPSRCFCRVPLARLSGLTAGLATFGVLTHRERRRAQLGAGDARHGRRVRRSRRRRRSGSRLPGPRWRWRRRGRFSARAIGLRLRASREDESAARSIGVGVAA